MNNWWSLPGPRNFVETVIQDVRDGKSVFISMPEHCPDRLSAFLEMGLREFPWISLTVTNDQQPLDFLYELCAPDADRSRLRSVHGLTLEGSFQGRVIWLQDLCGADWNAWSKFFVEYERASRAVPVSRRTYFLGPITANHNSCPIPPGVGISARKWDGWIRRSDLMLFATARTQDAACILESDLKSAVVTTLAGWDPELCEWLTPLKLQQLIEPGVYLKEFAESRDWDLKEKHDPGQSWSKGLSHTFRGKVTPHTCVTALSNGTGSLQELIWRAEIGVLMPYIEEQRQLIIERYSQYLEVNIRTAFGELIDDVYGLEIGLIEYQLSRRSNIPRRELKRITDLKDARNSLSHLSPVVPQLLLAICAESTRS